MGMSVSKALSTGKRTRISRACAPTVCQTFLRGRTTWWSTAIVDSGDHGPFVPAPRDIAAALFHFHHVVPWLFRAELHRGCSAPASTLPRKRSYTIQRIASSFAVLESVLPSLFGRVPTKEPVSTLYSG